MLFEEKITKGVERKHALALDVQRAACDRYSIWDEEILVS